jgi:GDP-4-dehydro-6-deoxy-D-mannose reductase
VKKKVLITGIHGFCARHLVRFLLAGGEAEIHGVDIAQAPPEGLHLAGYARMDVLDKARLDEAVNAIKPDMVFHLAGITKGSAADVYHANFMGCVFLLESVSRHAPHARVLVVGSAAEYGHVPAGEMPVDETHACNPYTPYGISKYAASLAALEYARRGLHVSVARPFNVIGPGIPEAYVAGALVARIRRSLQENSDEVRVGNLSSRRDFVYIDDLVEAYACILDGGFKGEVFNICSGEAIEIQTLADGLLSRSQKPLRLVVDPALVRSNEVDVMYGSYEKAARAFGFKPGTDIENALDAIWTNDMKGWQ